MWVHQEMKRKRKCSKIEEIENCKKDIKKEKELWKKKYRPRWKLDGKQKIKDSNSASEVNEEERAALWL